jgi:hypothetical protein
MDSFVDDDGNNEVPAKNACVQCKAIFHYQNYAILPEHTSTRAL